MSVETNTMGDDEFAEYMSNLPEEEEQEPQEEESEATEEVEEEEVEADLEDTKTEDETEEVDDTTGDTQDTDETEEEEADEESQTDEEETEDDGTEDTEEDTPETNAPDYKAFYEQVTADYKANGKTMPGLKDPKDFQTALSMASNYALKTTAMKPHLGRVKMLKDVSDAQLNEMLDFHNRNPEVIKKAFKEAGLDPMEIDITEEVAYSAKDYSISPEAIEFEELIDTIKGTPEFEVTSKVVTEVWDEKSKAAMLADPRLIKALNDEVEMGRYDTIQGIIDQQKLLGRTGGLTDLEMYQEIATTMNEEEAKVSQQAPVKEVVQPKVKVEDPAVKQKKKQAGINTKKVSSAVKKHDPTKLSDDEFLALVDAGAKFI